MNNHASVTAGITSTETGAPLRAASNTSPASSLQSRAMTASSPECKRFVRVVLWLFMLIALSAYRTMDPLSAADQRAQGPSVAVTDDATGDFDWTRFAGVYRFGACSHSPRPIWADMPGKTHVVIDVSRDYTVYPRELSLDLVRKTDEWHPIGLGWSFRDINAGPQEDSRGRTWESHTTTDGIYGILRWNDPYSVGFSTLRLTMDASGGVVHEMVQKSDSDQVGVRRERCTLNRQSDDRQSDHSYPDTTAAATTIVASPFLSPTIWIAF